MTDPHEACERAVAQAYAAFFAGEVSYAELIEELGLFGVRVADIDEVLDREARYAVEAA